MLDQLSKAQGPGPQGGLQKEHLVSILLGRSERARAAVSTAVVHYDQNAILASLPTADSDSIRSQLSRVRLVQEQVITELGAAVEHVYFMEQGIVSLTTKAAGGGPGLQVGMIGSEGFIGFSALFGAGIPAVCNATVQMPGTALRIPVASFRLWLDKLPSLYEACMKQLSVVMAQFACNAACNGTHSLLGRCANWLLATHERSDGRDSLLTHEYMAETLGVRRSGVTVALGALKAAGAIEHGRGRIRVIDAVGLDRLSCGCFRLGRRQSEPQSDRRSDLSGSEGDQLDAAPASMMKHVAIAKVASPDIP